MSDEVEEKEHFDLEASTDHIFQQSGYECPLCRAKAWIQESGPGVSLESSEPQDPPTVLPTHLGGFGTISNFIPTLTFTCHNCGFIRQHNLAWLKKIMKPVQHD